MIVSLAVLALAAPPADEAPKKKRLQLEPAGLLQVRYTYRTDQNGNDGQTDAFEVPRARFIFKGAFEKRLDFELGVDFGNFELSLLDAYANVRAYKRHLQVRAGRMKRPLVRERLQSAKNLGEVDRAPAGKDLGARRDFGLMLHNGFGDEAGIEWAAGIFADLEPLDFAAEETDFRPVAAARLGWNSSDELDPYVPWDREATSKVRYGLAAATLIMLDTDVVPDRDTGWRFEGDAVLKVAGATLGAGGGLSSADLDGAEPAFWTAFGMASYAFLDDYGVSVRYTHARTEATRALVDNELTVALSAWFFHDHLRLQVDGSWLDLESDTANNDFRVRAQLQVQ